jgi:hypothetical protein
MPMELRDVKKRIERLEATRHLQSPPKHPELEIDLAAQPWLNAADFQDRYWIMAAGLERLLGCRFILHELPAVNIDFLSDAEAEKAMLDYLCLDVALDSNALPGYGMTMEEFVTRVVDRLVGRLLIPDGEDEHPYEPLQPIK